MKVLLVNGSPHAQGCTAAALSVVAEALAKEGVGTESYWIGTKPIGGCIGCNQCAEQKTCVFDDQVNAFCDRAADFDGFVIGSPVYYAGINGSLKSLLDRVFYSSTQKEPHPFRLKPAAALVSARRSGTTAALDQLNKFFLHQQMPVVPSRYWNMVHGSRPEDVFKDGEGIQTLRVLARNMAWMLRLIELGDLNGIARPVQEPRILTNFIR